MLHYAASTDADQAYVNNRIPGYCLETSGAANLLSEALSGMEVDYERMERSASSEWSTASELADVLVRKTGLSFRDAHDLVARVVRISEETHERDVTKLLAKAADEAQMAIDVTDVVDEKTLDVRRFVESRNSQGGTSKVALSVLMEQARTRHLEHQKTFSGLQETVQLAKEKLLRDARVLAIQK
jgi:argininosuccinate lyase